MHALTDGRDCEDGTSIPLMETLCKDLQALSKKGVDARVASGGGRMCTTMDRYEAGPCHVHQPPADLSSYSSAWHICLTLPGCHTTCAARRSLTDTSFVTTACQRVSAEGLQGHKDERKVNDGAFSWGR